MKQRIITNKDLLYPELSYQIQGSIYAVANKYGRGFKEGIYQKALAEEFTKREIPFEPQKRIPIYSVETGKVLGTYVPDFVVDNKIILELKASVFTTQEDIRQQQSYLRSSNYEVGYLVNFGVHPLFIKRSVYSNHRKPFLALLDKHDKKD